MNYKMIQDQPDQLKVQACGGNDQPLLTAADGSLNITSTGLAVTTGAGLLGISVDGRVIIDTDETIANVSSTTSSGATPEYVLPLPNWTIAVKNDALAENAQAIVQLQLSPTASSESDWANVGSAETIDQNSITLLSSSTLMKYARVYYKAVDAASAVTLNIVLQGRF